MLSVEEAELLEDGLDASGGAPLQRACRWSASASRGEVRQAAVLLRTIAATSRSSLPQGLGRACPRRGGFSALMATRLRSVSRVLDRPAVLEPPAVNKAGNAGEEPRQVVGLAAGPPGRACPWS